MCLERSERNGFYHVDNSKTGYNGIGGIGNQTSCLKWYAYSEQNGNVNLLLDHNTNGGVIGWITNYNNDYGSEIPSLAPELGITYPNGITGEDSYGSFGNWNKGPITLLNQLKANTNGWNAILNRTDSYTASNNYNNGTVIDRYTINYSGYKARIITSQEIAYITGNMTWDEKTSTMEGDFSKSHFTFGSSYGWLYDRTSDDCTQYGCLNNSDGTIFGYWTVSPDASDSYHALGVNWSGCLTGYRVFNGGYGIKYGLRPVITVSKSSIFES